MLPSLDDVRAVLHAHLKAGRDDRDVVNGTVVGMVLGVASHEELARMAADKLVSLAIATERTEDGDRIAFAGKNQEGKRIIVHTEYASKPEVLRETGLRRIQSGKRAVREGYRLLERAEQLELAFEKAA